VLRLIASDQSKLLGLPCFLGSRVCKLLRQKKKHRKNPSKHFVMRGKFGGAASV